MFFHQEDYRPEDEEGDLEMRKKELREAISYLIRAKKELEGICVSNVVYKEAIAGINDACSKANELLIGGKR